MIIAFVAVLCHSEPLSTPSFSASPTPYISCSSSPSPSLSHTSSSSQLDSSLAPSMTSTSPPLAEPANVQSPSRSDSDTFAELEGASSLLADVDPQIIESLKSKDRIYVLKLGEQMECLINDRRFVLPISFHYGCVSRDRGTALRAQCFSVLLTTSILQALH